MEISVALGGGGAKGAAHIGVLRCLEQNGFSIRAVAGTSVGGIIGAIYAAGVSPDEMLARFGELDFPGLYRRRPGDGPALLGVAGVNRVLTEVLGEQTFADLRIPLALTAVDLNSGKEVVLKHGRVVEAVLATMALPGIFPPQPWEGYLLVDGGLMDPVPVAPARNLAPALPVVAVVLLDVRMNPLETLEPPSFLGPAPLLRQIAHHRLGQAFTIFLQSLNISSHYLTEMRLRMDAPEIIIRPDVGDIDLLDPVDVPEVSRRGERAAALALPQLRRVVSWHSRLARRLQRSLLPVEGRF